MQRFFRWTADFNAKDAVENALTRANGDTQSGKGFLSAGKQQHTLQTLARR